MFNYSNFLKQLNESTSDKTISVEFTPHEEFHKYRWLLPKGGKWYYRMRDFKPMVIPKNKNFISSVDPLLRGSVEFLHSRKIPTTPSCTGHFSNTSEWEEVYDSLIEDAKKIRKDGIILTDAEDGSSYKLKHEKYVIPWKKSIFVERALEHSKFGIIGIYDSGGYFFKKLSRIENPHCQTKKEDAITFFLTSPTNEKELLKCWEDFHKTITTVI
jgi:hypothetical protein